MNGLLLRALEENLVPLEAEESLRHALETSVGTATGERDDRRKTVRDWERRRDGQSARRQTAAEVAVMAGGMGFTVEKAKA